MTDEEKEAFYKSLTDAVDKVPKGDKLLILGDFNTGVGKDHVTYEDVLGKFAKGNKNSNGDLLLNFCTQRSHVLPILTSTTPTCWITF